MILESQTNYEQDSYAEPYPDVFASVTKCINNFQKAFLRSSPKNEKKQTRRIIITERVRPDNLYESIPVLVVFNW
jgi:hypothetical protein